MIARVTTPLRVLATAMLGLVLTGCVSETPGATPTAPALSITPSSTAAAVATPTPTRRLLVTPTPLPTSRVTVALITHENPILGYRVNLPEEVRRVGSGIVTGNEQALGHDLYTGRTEAEDRAACLSDAGGRPSPDGHPVLGIHVARNPGALSAEVWATTPRAPGSQPMSTHMLVERTTIDGRETVRLVRDQVTNHETAGYVIRGNDRIYTLGFESDSIPSRLPRGWLDTVAASFRVIQPAPFPTATPPPAIAPLDAARELGQRLSRAFAARDVDAIAGLITPRCWLGTLPAVEPGVGVDGSARAVVPFLAALRESFARGGVAVVVDPNVQLRVEGTGIFRYEQYFVRSDWTAAGATMRIDLYLQNIDGTSYWEGARHYPFPGNPCSDLRVIWGGPSGIGQC